MGANSTIEWTNRTWNPVTGCTKVSAGCKHCYAEREWARLSANDKTVYYDREFTDVRYHHKRLEQPLHWRKPSLVFVNSMSDLFHPDVPFEFTHRVMCVIGKASPHDFQILTKRPARALEFVDWCDRHECPAEFAFPENVWLGVSVESPELVGRIDALRLIPAAVKFVSFEPLLAAIPNVDLSGIDWVIVGGESGPQARPMHPDWPRSLRDQAVAAGVPFFFKQWGEWAAVEEWNALKDSQRLIELGSEGTIIEDIKVGGRIPFTQDGSELMYRVGKKAAGRLLDGREWNEYPAGWVSGSTIATPGQA